MKAMEVSKALEFADEWAKGHTFYPGAEGWRVVCATLAAEVRRLRVDKEMSDKLPMNREQIQAELEKLIPHFDLRSKGKKDLVITASEHILRIGTTELREENKRLRNEVESLAGECLSCGQRADK